MWLSTTKLLFVFARVAILSITFARSLSFVIALSCAALYSPAIAFVSPACAALPLSERTTSPTLPPLRIFPVNGSTTLPLFFPLVAFVAVFMYLPSSAGSPIIEVRKSINCWFEPLFRSCCCIPLNTSPITPFTFLPSPTALNNAAIPFVASKDASLTSFNLLRMSLIGSAF